MYKQVKRVSLTFALFVFTLCLPVVVFAPPNVPAPSNGAIPGVTPIDETLVILLLVGLLIGSITIKKHQGQPN
jgi:hypothetical protein